MMKKIKILLMTLVLFTGPSSHAVGILGGANFFGFSGGGANTEFGILAGLSFEGRTPGLHTEFDLMYGQNKFNNGSLSFIHLPILVRFTLLPLIDVGLGPYLSYILDSTSNHFDIGLVPSIRFHPAPAITLEGRYLLGFTHLSGAGTNTQTRAIQVLLGISI